MSKDHCILRLSKNVTLYEDFVAYESLRHDGMTPTSFLLADHFFRNFFGIECFDFILKNHGSTIHRLGLNFLSKKNLHELSNLFVEMFKNNIDDFADVMKIMEIVSHNEDCDLEYYLTKEIEDFVTDVSNIYKLITNKNIDHKYYIKIYSILSKSMGEHLLPIIEMTNLFIEENLVSS